MKRYGSPKKCECPRCGHVEEKERRLTCRNKVCPECNTRMVRKREQ